MSVTKINIRGIDELDITGIDTVSVSDGVVSFNITATPAVTPGGSSGDIQFNSGTSTFAGSAATITSGGTLTIPSGQTINLAGLSASEIVATDSSKNLVSITALPNGTTATTQSQADGSTKVATTAYVDTGLATKQATLTGTGIVRNTGAATELSGDVTTSGSNVATVVQIEGAAIPASATIVGTNSSKQIVDASSASLTNNTSGTASNLSGTPALPNGTTATTQTAGDNTAKLATDAFVTTAVAGKINSSVMTTLGDMIYENATPAPDRVPGNVTTTRNFLRQTGTGSVSAAPVWDTLVAGDIPNLDASKITTGTLALARGGTNVDLSASGGATFVLAQDASHVITARALVSGDIPNNAANTSGTASNLSGTPALPNGTTATTQSPGDNSTKLATTAYADELTPAEATSGEGGFFNNGLNIWDVWPNSGSNGTATNYTATRVICLQFRLRERTTIGHVTFSLAVKAGVAATCNFGIYNHNRTVKLLDTGAIDINSTTGPITQAAASFNTPSGTSVTIEPGIYWYAFAATVSATAQYYQLGAPGSTQGNLVNAVAIRMGMTDASHVLSGGALPSALGTPVNTNVSFPLAFFEP